MASQEQVSLNSNWTFVAALVDCSGSMLALNPENTAKELTGLISEQKDDISKRVDVSVARFSAPGTYNMFIENKPAQDVVITAQDIRPDGSTALYESLAKLIQDIGKTLSDMTTERPGKVVIIILTDGNENSSIGDYHGEAGRKRVAEMIKHQQDVYSWKFYFLGANIDAITVGKGLGILGNTCINYAATSNGCTNVMRSASQAVKRYRSVQAEENTDSNAGGFTQDERLMSSMPVEYTQIEQPVVNLDRFRYQPSLSTSTSVRKCQFNNLIVSPPQDAIQAAQAAQQALRDALPPLVIPLATSDVFDVNVDGCKP
jgi:hypothetical protein